jgi:hypothetical protein
VNGRRRLLDFFLLATVFTVTFAQLRWVVGGADVNVSDVTASAFVVTFLVSRIDRSDAALTRTAAVLVAFFTAFALVYLVGFFGLETSEQRNLFTKGLAKFAIHFAFLVTGVAYLARRSQTFYWRALGWFVAGIAVNGAYGVVELVYAELTGGELDHVVLAPLTDEVRSGINVFGAVAGVNVYRANALMLDPNHLGIVLIVPLLVVLPIYLRLERGHRLRVPLAVLLSFLVLAELATLSRSGFLGLAVGLLVLALPYRRLLLSARVLVPATAIAAVVALVVGQRTGFFETVLQARANLEGGSTRVHLELYELVPPILADHALFGLGLNTFSAYYEFVTGRTNWGPHSYYIALLAETGIVGTLVFLAYLAYLFRRLGALRALGQGLARAGDRAGARVRPLGWGLTAALVGTLTANAFYLTMQMYYFFAFATVALAAPVVFARRTSV